MSKYMFGAGRGEISKAAAKRIDAIARKHGASLVTTSDPQCNCGYGCRPFSCARSARYWFAGPNLGAPFDAAMAHAIYADIDAAHLTDADGSIKTKR